jgi:DnaJ domain
MSWRAFWVADRLPFDLSSRWVRQHPARNFAPRIRDPYEILGLSPSATAGDVKKSFRTLAKALHPDANNDDPTAGARFAEVNSAYEVLGDEDKREAFDRGDIDAEGNLSYRGLFPLGRSGLSTPHVVTAVVIGSILASLLLIIIRLTPHTVLPDFRAQEEQAGAAPALPTDHLLEPRLVLQQDLPHAAVIAEPQPQLDAKQVDLLIQRSQDLISEGDVAAARILLRRAAEVNNARAAITLGATYDPVVLTTLRAQGVAADVSQARLWYTKASALGSEEARIRLNLLPTR